MKTVSQFNNIQSTFRNYKIPCTILPEDNYQYVLNDSDEDNIHLPLLSGKNDNQIVKKISTSGFLSFLDIKKHNLQTLLENPEHKNNKFLKKSLKKLKNVNNLQKKQEIIDSSQDSKDNEDNNSIIHINLSQKLNQTVKNKQRKNFFMNSTQSDKKIGNKFIPVVQNINMSLAQEIIKKDSCEQVMTNNIIEENVFVNESKQNSIDPLAYYLNNNKSPQQIQCDLNHNKFIKYDMQNILNQENIKMQKELEFLIKFQSKLMKKCQKIKSQPSQIISFLTQGGDDIMNNSKDDSQKQKSDGSPLLQETPNQQNQIQRKKREINSELFISGKYNYSVYQYRFDQTSWMPPFRECTQLVFYKKQAYMFGGIGAQLYNDLNVLNLENYSWSNVKASEGKAPSCRHSHSTVLYKNYLIIFGGEGEYVKALKQRECRNDTYSFNLINRQWKQLQCKNSLLQPRRAHAMGIVGKYLFVHGGITADHNRVLYDLWILDLQTLYWQEALLYPNDVFIASNHSCCPIFYDYRKMTNIHLYKQLDNKYMKMYIHKVKIEGFYFFGGLGADGQILKDLKILLIDQHPMKIITPQVLGKPPCSRYGNSMSHDIINLNIITIYGGIGEKQEYLSDIFILDLNSLTWVQPKSCGDFQIERAFHLSGFYESKLIIFGGINSEGYIGNSQIIVELDQNKVRQYIESQQKSQSQIKYSLQQFNNNKNMKLKKNYIKLQLIKPIDINQIHQISGTNINFQDDKSEISDSSDYEIFKDQGYNEILNNSEKSRIVKENTQQSYSQQGIIIKQQQQNDDKIFFFKQVTFHSSAKRQKDSILIHNQI